MAIGADDWLDGGAPQESYALPWAVHSLQHQDVEQSLGRLDGTFVDEIGARLEAYVRHS